MSDEQVILGQMSETIAKKVEFLRVNLKTIEERYNKEDVLFIIHYIIGYLEGLSEGLAKYCKKDE